MATWEKLATDDDVLTLRSEKLTRAVERSLIFGSVMEAANASAEKAFRHEYYNKTAGIITVHTDFEQGPGYQITVPYTPSVFNAGVQGDARAKDQSINLTIDGLNLRYSAVRLPFQSSGKVQEKYSVLKFLDVAEGSGKRWFPRQIEGSIWTQLNGLSSVVNTSRLTYLNIPNSAGTITDIMGNTVSSTAHDAAHILYAPFDGSITTNAGVAADPTATLSASGLDLIIKELFQDSDEPPEMIDVGGNQRPGVFMFLDYEGMNQLRADPAFQRIFQQTSGAENYLAKMACGRYRELILVEYSHCLMPIANVMQGLICGRNSLQFVKVSGIEPWRGTDDTHDWVKLYALAAMYGAVPTYFQSARKTTWAVRYYVTATS